MWRVGCEADLWVGGGGWGEGGRAGRMRAESSATVSGGRCRKRRRLCRELRWGSIFCGYAGVAAAAMSRANSRKKNFLFSKVEIRKSKTEKSEIQSENKSLGL